MENQAILIEQVLDAPVSLVWKAISDKKEMKKWYFDLAEFKPDLGFKFQFMGGPSPEKQYLHLCEILEALPKRKLSYSWRYDGYEGNSIVCFELFAQGNKTLLKLSHTGIKSFPKDQPDFDISNFNEGWTYLINTALKEYLKKNFN